MIPIKIFSTTSHVNHGASSSTLSRTSSTESIKTFTDPATPNDLWYALQSKQTDMRKAEKELEAEWRLANIDRFPHIVCNPDTRAIVEIEKRLRVREREERGTELRKAVKDGSFVSMNANLISLGNQSKAVVAQYPTCNNNKGIPSMQQELTRHIHMLLNDKAPILVVLASDSVMAKNNIHNSIRPYFSQSGDYYYDQVAELTRVHVTPESNEKIANQSLNIASYQMRITHAPIESTDKKTVDKEHKLIPEYFSQHTLPVLHVKNAPDRTGALSAHQLHELVSLVKQRMDSQAQGEPVLVDISGTGPAAQLAIALHIQLPTTLAIWCKKHVSNATLI